MDEPRDKSPSSGIRVLLVDNDKDHAAAMAESLQRIGLGCTVATSGPDGARAISEQVFDVVVTDLVMNDVDGMQVLKLAREKLPECEVIMVTGHATVPKAVEAMQQGAFNFLEKPITPKRLQAVTSKAADSVRLRNQNRELQSRLDERFGFENLVFASDSMKAVIERVKRIAPTDVGVLITGETGTGKDVLAQAIHQNSPRRKKPFVAINTAAVAEHLVESELFGHVKGAFTDAITDRVGKFEFAQGGTLLLDEIGDMPMATQIKLLRVLEERQIVRVGDNRPVDVNVRVLAATNKNLEGEIEAGRFRRDLYYRLNIVTLHLEPLRNRREDILPLADLFRRQANQRNGKRIKGFTPDLRRWMYEYQWTGNIRQLKNVVESMVVLDVDHVLGMDDLSPEFDAAAGQGVLAPHQPVQFSVARPDVDSAAGQGGPAAPPASFDGSVAHLVGKSLRDIERWAIKQTLMLVNGNREETARTLGISERNLYRKLKEYGLS